MFIRASEGFDSIRHLCWGMVYFEVHHIITWLVVWNMNFIFHFIYGMSSFPLTSSYFSRWLKPPTRSYSWFKLTIITINIHGYGFIIYHIIWYIKQPTRSTFPIHEVHHIITILLIKLNHWDTWTYQKLIWLKNWYKLILLKLGNLDKFNKWWNMSTHTYLNRLNCYSTIYVECHPNGNQ